MREILFRAKATSGLNAGKWVEGFFVKDFWFPVSRGHGIIPADKERGGYCEVYPETVGQFTGLIDANGAKIFEGDIVEGHCHSQWRHELQRCEVAYCRDGFEARHHVKCGEEQRYYTYKVLFSKDVVVIGNIHDNPELLEG